MNLKFISLMLLSVVLLVGGIFFNIKSTTKVIEGSAGEIYILPEVVTDTKIVIRKGGSDTNPFIVKANPNGTQFLGSSSVYIEAKNVTVDGIHFIDNQIIYKIDNEALIKIGNYNRDVRNVIVKNCIFKYNVSTYNNDDAFHWIRVSGNDILIENCVFEGKRNMLPIIHVNAHYEGIKIKNNTFKNVRPRKGEALEAIRIGLTKGSSKTLVANNVFEHYYGDSETISCKADSARIINNTFLNSRSGVCLRWGSGTIVKNNYFDNVTYAVRVAGKNHEISDNIFNNSGEDIVFMLGNKAYQSVKNIKLENNFFKNKPKIKILTTPNSDVIPDSLWLRNNIEIRDSVAHFMDNKLLIQERIKKNLIKRRVAGNLNTFFEIDIDAIKDAN